VNVLWSEWNNTFSRSHYTLSGLLAKVWPHGFNARSFLVELEELATGGPFYIEIVGTGPRTWKPLIYLNLCYNALPGCTSASDYALLQSGLAPHGRVLLYYENPCAISSRTRFHAFHISENVCSYSSGSIYFRAKDYRVAHGLRGNHESEICYHPSKCISIVRMVRDFFL
jgi:hypothetical protein